MIHIKRVNLFHLVLKFQTRRQTGLSQWHEDVNSEINKKIERYWHHNVAKYYPIGSNKQNYYVLSMFPYPSGNLHLGHVRVYSISDTMARFFRLNGYNVIHPMGWDSFGLPAENAAIERKIDPLKWTTANVEKMKGQFAQMGFNFDWSREVTTCRPDYYKWTQYIFLKLHDHGLVYRKKASVNWDPVDKTVLADEQVDDNGRSWRSGAVVEKKFLNQWFVKTTQFAHAMYEGLNDDGLENWRDIINLQMHWIGECNGVSITVALKSNNELIKSENLEIWTAKPDTFLTAKFIAVSSDYKFDTDYSVTEENSLCKRLSLTAVNPITEEEMPIFVTNQFEFPEGRDTYLGSPAISIEDKRFALNVNLPWTEDLHDKFSKLNEEARSKYVCDIAHTKKVGGYWVSSKLRDWLISRQRYWGTPIPIIHCQNCGTVPVPYSELPVQLPSTDCYRISHLSEFDHWVKCACPKCGNTAKRETDTMDTFVDSSWYYLRYLDPTNQNVPFDIEKVKNSVPVNLYIGGKEHAVLHLYYARFMNYFFHSIGWLDTKEPFKRLVVQGMVMGKSFKVKSTGKYIAASEVEITDNKCTEKVTGEVVETQWEKMSKSKYNGVNPADLIAEYGCDTTRLFMLADFAPPSHRHWSNETFPGVINWQHRIWLAMREFIEARNSALENKKEDILKTNKFRDDEKIIIQARNHFVMATTFNLKYTQQLSIAISRLQGLTSSLRKASRDVIALSEEYEKTLGAFIIMLAPFAPHFASELWSGFAECPNRINLASFDWTRGVLEQSWPTIDDDFQLSFICKINGAEVVKSKIIPKELNDLTETRALEIMLNHEKVKKRLKNGVSKVVFTHYPNCSATLNIIPVILKKKKALLEAYVESK